MENVENVENVESQKVKAAGDPILFPASFVEYKMKHPLTNDTFHDIGCDYCPEPIKPGDKYFTIKVDHTFTPKTGHLTHLKSAPAIEWKPDPAKYKPQPWEMDPSIPAPPGWEEWKRKHEWAVPK